MAIDVDQPRTGQGVHVNTFDGDGTRSMVVAEKIVFVQTLLTGTTRAPVARVEDHGAKFNDEIDRTCQKTIGAVVLVGRDRLLVEAATFQFVGPRWRNELEKREHEQGDRSSLNNHLS